MTKTTRRGPRTNGKPPFINEKIARAEHANVNQFAPPLLPVLHTSGCCRVSYTTASLPHLAHSDGVDRRLDVVHAVADGERLGFEPDRAPVRGGGARGVDVHVNRLGRRLVVQVQELSYQHTRRSTEQKETAKDEGGHDGKRDT